MQSFSIKKTIGFILLTAFFSFTSIILSDLLINKFNNFDFKLFQIDYVKNYGAAFSLFSQYTTFLIIISSIILLFILCYIFTHIGSFNKKDFLYSSLLIAGIICNLSERIIDGYVTDYIRLNFVAFPIFNISDIFICIGAFALICAILFGNEQND